MCQALCSIRPDPILDHNLITNSEEITACYHTYFRDEETEALLMGVENKLQTQSDVTDPTVRNP